MNHLIIIDQIWIPTSDFFYNSQNQSNYANYQSTSVTKSGGALIDILENVILTLDKSTNH